MKQNDIFYSEEMKELSLAMFKAYQAFNDYFEDNHMDGAYFDLKLTGYYKDSEFNNISKLDLDFNLYKEDKE